MADLNTSGGKKAPRNFDTGRGHANTQPGPFVGEIMDTYDSTNSGRIKVWIRTFGDERTKSDPSGWFSMRYLSPFFGVSPHEVLDAPDPDFETNGHSYGMWFNTPDVGVEVLCIFAEGDPNQGYYIGFIPTQQMTHMIPAIGAQENPHYNNSDQESKLASATHVPVTEIDKKVESINDANYLDIPRPVHSVLAGQYWKQGLLTDRIRGPITSSAQRESPSNVFGVNTPGRPVYNKGMFDHNIREKLESGEETDTGIVGRRGGHSFVMDDGDVEGNDTLVRIRTASGHQIIMSDNGRSIYISHASGNVWLELGAEGTIDGYASNSVNFRSGGDINLHADKNLNIHALENINLVAGKSMNMEADKDLTIVGKNKTTMYSKLTLEIKSDGVMALDGRSSISVKSTGKTDIVGALVGLNDPGAGKDVTAPKETALNNFPDSSTDTTDGWKSEAGKFKSVASRVPTHEPYTGHGAGIPSVKTP